jgi:hypothetical protein
MRSDRRARVRDDPVARAPVFHRGSIATSIGGEPRSTLDIDIVTDLTS